MSKEEKGVRDVHLITVGTDAERIKAGLRRMSADKVYLLHSPDGARASDGEVKDFAAIAKSMAEDLRAAGYDVSLEEVPPYDLGGIVYRMVGISRRERDAGPVRFWVNISGGTNLMAGAATAASYFLGATVYYVLRGEGTLQEKVVEFPTPAMPDADRLGDTALDCLRYVASHEAEGDVTNARMARDMGWSPQKANHSVGVLRDWHLLDVTRGTGPNGRNMRESRITLTDHGRLYAAWLPAGRDRSEEPR